jgi:predicted DNA-binding transcriptional regulator AlpA
VIGSLESEPTCLPEPEPPVEHAPDCPCSGCSGDPFLSRLVLAVVPEAHGRPEHTKSCIHPRYEATSHRAGTDGKRRKLPVAEPPGDILTPEQVAERLQVSVSWVYVQTGHRARVRNPDPLPYRKMGRYLRFSWAEVQEWLNRQNPEARRASVSTPRREVLRGEKTEGLHLVRQTT